MSESREMHIKNDTPNGFCKKCRMYLVHMDGQLKCPHCSTLTNNEPPSINLVEDPGEEAFTVDGMKNDSISQINQLVSVPEKLKGKGSIEGCLNEVFEIVGRTPINSLPQAKKLLKIKKQILDLQTAIKLFQEEN